MNAEIRPAEEKDMDQLVGLGRSFFEESPFASFSSFDETSFRASAVALMAGGQTSTLLVVSDGADVLGMAASMTYPLYFNLGIFISQEIFWFMKSGNRNGVGDTLLDELEADSMRKGAVAFMSASLPGNRDRAFERFYRRRGYSPSETSYMRKLSS